MSMSKVRIENSEKELEVESDKDLLSALRDKEVYVKSSCGGHGSCGDCVVKVTFGEDNLSPQTFAELQLLGNVFHITKERLSCQTKVTGNITLDMSGHNQTQDEERRDFKNKKYLKKVIRRKPQDKKPDQDRGPKKEEKQGNQGFRRPKRKN